MQHSNYETLRSWYLAKLRKSAIEAQVSGQLTPSALIAADREVIEKLIAERTGAEDNQASPRSKKLASAMIFSILIWLYLIVGSILSLFLFCLADSSIFFDVLSVSINPANFAAPGHALPSPLMMIILQSVFFVYPLAVFPAVFFSMKDKQQ